MLGKYVSLWLCFCKYDRPPQSTPPIARISTILRIPRLFHAFTVDYIPFSLFIPLIYPVSGTFRPPYGTENVLRHPFPLITVSSAGDDDPSSRKQTRSEGEYLIAHKHVRVIITQNNPDEHNFVIP